jgi:CheY-like chemotaxis protein
MRSVRSPNPKRQPDLPVVMVTAYGDDQCLWERREKRALSTLTDADST